VTPQEISAAVRTELDGYRPPLGARSPLGAPRSTKDIQSEIAVLRGALVLPSRRRIAGGDLPAREVWLIAAHDDSIVFLDDADHEYGLGALNAEGEVEDYNVRGDLVGCFMAR